jgi:hypothetical protein
MFKMKTLQIIQLPDISGLIVFLPRREILTKGLLRYGFSEELDRTTKGINYGDKHILESEILQAFF